MAEPQSAKARFFTLTALRIVATLLVVFGMIIAFGERGWFDPSVAMPLGIVMIIAGFLDLVVVVPMLTRRWRSPE